MNHPKYTFQNFLRDFPDEDACLDYIFQTLYPNLTQYYRVQGRKCYANPQGHQIHPLAKTIFEKSSTPLRLWIYAIFLFSASKNGVAAKELQRHLGVTYKTAWRMARQIRKLMEDEGFTLSGNVEADETYIGGYRKGGYGGRGKAPVLGFKERGGNLHARHIPARQSGYILKEIADRIKPGSRLLTDKFRVYRQAERMGYRHESVDHWKKEYVRGDVHTNNLEGFWSQVKRSVNGTYHSVSLKHLHSYVDEFVYYHNHRSSGIFRDMLERV